jgi:hypothetical protein
MARERPAFAAERLMEAEVEALRGFADLAQAQGLCQL